jgi:transposase
VRQASAYNKGVISAYEVDRENEVLIQQLLTIRKAAVVAAEVRDILCNCAKCTLERQNDFKNQKSELEEVYEKHNREYGTRHYCKFLPKFHPELNPIERCWSRMKWSIRKFCTGKLEQLRASMDYGLSEANLSTALIRRYTRIVSAYYIAYQDSKDIIEAESWIRKHRSHRGCSAKMDGQLEALYFPLGRDLDTGEEDREEVSSDGGIENVGEEDDTDEVDCSDFDAQLLMENELEIAHILAGFGEIIV